MQAAIDRVLRTFTLLHPAQLAEPRPNARPDAPRDEASAFAAQLLESYKGHLAQRGVVRD